MDREQRLDALLHLPRLLTPKVSPDGKWVCWTWMGAGPVADVYAAPTDGSAAPVCLTDGADNATPVSWTPDSRAVLVARDYHGNERFRLLRVDLSRPGQMTPLTEESPNYFLRGGQLDPSGRLLFYAANLDPDTGEEIEPFYTFRHDLATGRREAIARPPKPAAFLPLLNTPGTHILYDRKDLDPAGQQVWLVGADGAGDREILSAGADARVEASWLPDGRRVIAVAEKGSHRRVGVWDLQGEDTRWLIDDPSRNIEAAFVPHGSDRAVLVEVRDARVRASLLNLRDRSEAHLPEIAGNLLPLAPVSSDGREWVGQYYSSTQPADIVRFSLDNIDPRVFVSLTRVWDRTTLRSGDFFPARDFRWKSVDGLEIQGWLYRPEGEARGTVVYVHGGPTSHSEDKINAQIQFFAGEGFNVLDPNYRGSTGFGLTFMKAIKEDGWGGREQDDIRAGIEALIAQGIAQPGRSGMTGTSYGGYSAWCGITRFPPETLAASAPVCGMTDLVVDYYSTRPDLRPYSEEMIGGTPEQVPETYHERSPINFVGNIKGRLMVVQGMQDPNVSPENVRVVREALDNAGVKYEVMAFEDEGHGIRLPENQKRLYLRLARFFEEAFDAT